MAMDPMRALKARIGAARYALVTNRFLQQGALCISNGCTILTFRFDGYVDLSSAACCHATRFGPKESDPTARLMLDQFAKTPNWSTMSAVQASALADMLSTAELEPDRKLELLGLLVTVPWACDEHAHRVMEPLASDDTAAAQRGKRRRALQDYKAFVHYFSESMWESLNDSHFARRQVDLYAVVLGASGASPPDGAHCEAHGVPLDDCEQQVFGHDRHHLQDHELQACEQHLR